jgi:glycosyltransferase involved in cell wall biosynthesis
LVVPEGVDDPARPSGGNTYDRRLCTGLTALGWSVHVHAVPGAWPRPDSVALAALAEVVRGLPDGATLLVDGLIASCTPGVLAPEVDRLRVVALVHAPLDGLLGEGGSATTRDAELEVLSRAAAVLTPSTWCRRWLLEHYALDPARVHVAEPGTDTARPAPGTEEGGNLLCVAAVVPGKGHDHLVQALAQVADLAWRCTFVGALDLDPAFARRVSRQARESGIGERVRFTGALTADELNRRYAASDALLVASRFETYGLVVTEALARGLPVLAGSTGGVPEALGTAPDGRRPGLLVAAGDPDALAAAIRSWLSDARLRARLRKTAQARRVTLAPWSLTARRVAAVLETVGARP